MTRKEEIEARKAEIREEVEATEEIEKIEELTEEVENLDAEEKQIEEQEKTEAEAKELEEKKFVPKEIIKEERKIMNETEKKEFRNSKEYIDAYAEYIKSELIPGHKMSEEARALVTTGGYATGNNAVVEVPDLVDSAVRTAWERDEIAALVRRISVKGNYKVQFEVSGSDATVHQEGNGAVSEEELILGIVELPPKSIKKWISVTDEVLDLRGEEFLNYIYDEITYKIVKKSVDELISIIKALPTSLSANSDTGIYDKVSAAKLTEAPAVDTIAKAVANLSDEARNPVIIMNKQTYANFKALQLTANYGIDVFDGLQVKFNNSLPAYNSASANAVYCIVGDLNEGALINLPNGDDVTLKYDDKTQMEYDLVRILGRKYVGMNAVADRAFVNIAKPSTSA